MAKFYGILSGYWKNADHFSRNRQIFSLFFLESKSRLKGFIYDRKLTPFKLSLVHQNTEENTHLILLQCSSLNELPEQQKNAAVFEVF